MLQDLFSDIYYNQQEIIQLGTVSTNYQQCHSNFVSPALHPSEIVTPRQQLLTNVSTLSKDSIKSIQGMFPNSIWKSLLSELSHQPFVGHIHSGMVENV